MQNDVSTLKSTLDDKQVEHDKLVALMHHTRTEFTRKLEKQQQQYDMKISYLVNQLKLSEAKLNESVSVMRSNDYSRVEDSHTDDKTTEDVVTRRWQSEKERREQLERRNGELVREIRQLRDLTRNTKSSGSNNNV